MQRQVTQVRIFTTVSQPHSPCHQSLGKTHVLTHPAKHLSNLSLPLHVLLCCLWQSSHHFFWFLGRNDYGPSRVSLQLLLQQAHFSSCNDDDFLKIRIQSGQIYTHTHTLFFFFFRAAPAAFRGSWPRGRIGAACTSLYHSHSNVGSELRLWPTPQLTATLDPQPTEWGQGWNP